MVILTLLLNIYVWLVCRYDRILQRLVYKLVPGLYQSMFHFFVCSSSQIDDRGMAGMYYSHYDRRLYRVASCLLAPEYVSQ